MMLFGTYVNFVAVLVAAIVAFALGALWFSPPVFGRPWARAYGLDSVSREEMQKGAARAYALTFVAFLVAALALAIFIGRIGITYWLGGVKAGVLAALGFTATTTLITTAFTRRPLTGYLIDLGYYLVALALMGAIIGGWRS